MAENEKLIELTEKHKEHYPEYRERYIGYQLSTDATDHEKVEATLKDLYVRADYKAPQRVVFAPSPVVAAIVGCMAKTAIDAVAAKEYTKPVVISSMLEAIEKVSQHVHKYFNTIVDGIPEMIDPAHQPEPAKLNGIISRLAMKAADFAVTDKVGKADAKLVEAFKNSLKSFQSSWNGGNTWAYSHAHLVFFRDVMGATLPLAENFANYQYLNENSGPRMMYEEFVVVSERPVVLRTRVVNDVYQMHNATGASVAWADGVCLFHFENTQVSPWMIRNRPEELDPRLFARLSNVSQRAAFCRLVGMERILRANNARTIDSEPNTPNEYELLELMVDDQPVRYLSMKNQSLPDHYHVEGVELRCANVQQALNFRNRLRDDQICDETGVEWFQQGDVLIKPRGAKKFRSRPSILS